MADPDSRFADDDTSNAGLSGPGVASTGPLSGFTILDLSRVLSGPVATALLADQGADVIKVEPPSGDISRAIGGTGVSAGFLAANRGKRSIAVDLKNPKGIAGQAAGGGRRRLRAEFPAGSDRRDGSG